MWGFNPKTKDMTWARVATLLPRDIMDDGRVKPTDKIYQVPMLESLDYIMREVPSWKCKYVPEKHDCDDFVRDFRGWLSRKDWGNLLAMDTGVLHPDKGQHNLISFMCLDRQDKYGKHPLIFGEPQTGKIVSYHESRKYTDVRLRL